MSPQPRLPSDVSERFDKEFEKFGIFKPLVPFLREGSDGRTDIKSFIALELERQRAGLRKAVEKALSGCGECSQYEDALHAFDRAPVASDGE